MENVEYNLEQEIAEEMKNRLVQLASPLLDEMPPITENPKRMSLYEYKAFCSVYLGLKHPISDDLIARTSGYLKQTNNIALLQPEQWKNVVTKYLANSLPDDDFQNFITNFLDLLHQASLKRQKK